MPAIIIATETLYEIYDGFEVIVGDCEGLSAHVDFEVYVFDYNSISSQPFPNLLRFLVRGQFLNEEL